MAEIEQARKRLKKMVKKLKRALTKEWEQLVAELPVDLESSVQQYQALCRRREIKSGADLLRLILIYALSLSLTTTTLWAVGLQLGDLSRQALDKRILKSTAWLEYLLAALLPQVVPLSAVQMGGIRRLWLRDASVISRPGSPGTEWRLHLSWFPFELQPAHLSLSDEHQGEGLEPTELQAGDLVVGDRSYGLWRTIKLVLAASAFFIFRFTWSNLPLSHLSGEPFDLIAWLKTLPADQFQAEIPVTVSADPLKRPLRLVVGRLPEAKAKEARETARRQAQKKQHQVQPQTLIAAGFCLLLTNLPLPTWATASVLALYRLRWQIEWCFRRWKSLCQLEQLPPYPAKIAKPVLLAKLILILLLQQRLGQLPWLEWWTAPEPAPTISALVQMTYDRLRQIIQPAALLDLLLEDPTSFLRQLRASRRRRPVQLIALFQRFVNRLVPASSFSP